LLLHFLWLLRIAAAASTRGHAELMRIAQNDLSRHHQGTNISSGVVASAAQQHGVSGRNNIDRLSQQISMNLDHIQRTVDTNEIAAFTAVSSLDQQDSLLPQMTGSIRSNTNVNTNVLDTLQQSQWMFSPRVSQYARLLQRRQDAIAAAATTAHLQREQEQRAANVAAIVAAQNNLQHQNRMDQLQRDLQTLQQMNNLRIDLASATTSHFLPTPRTTLSTSSPASLALSLARNPMMGTNMALMRQRHQQQQELELQILMIQRSNIPTSLVSSTSLVSTSLQHQSSMRSQQMHRHHSPTEQWQALGRVNHNRAAHTIPLSLPICLAQSDDEQKLSDHQYFLRQQIEAFQATQDDLMTHTRGRNKPIHVGQVGIRCRHCAHIPVSRRQRGSTYFPSKKLGIYQAAQNMSTAHIQCGLCTEMPEEIKLKFVEIMSAQESNCSSGAGRPYWAQSATQLGLVDTEEGIRFIRNVPPGIVILE
jgi:hypothetical protein